MARREETDPYAPPPMYHMKSGGLVRFAILAVLLGGAALGYGYYSSQPHHELAAQTEEAQPQQMADNSGLIPTSPAELPANDSATVTPTPAPAPAPVRTQRSAPRASSPPPVDTPPPTTTVAPPTAQPVQPLPELGDPTQGE